MKGHFHLETHVCAWCKRELGFGPGNVCGIPATNYGMCANCLAEQLVDPLLRPSQSPVAVYPA